MSHKHFDQQIKKKLESVQPPYDPAAWQRFQPLLPQPGHVLLLQKYGSLLFGGIATIAFIITLFFYHQEHRQNKQLKKEIIALQTASSIREQRPSPSVSVTKPSQSTQFSSTNPSTIRVAPDTFYVIREVFIKKESDNQVRRSTLPDITHGTLDAENPLGKTHMDRLCSSSVLIQENTAAFYVKRNEVLAESTFGIQATAAQTRKDTLIGLHADKLIDSAALVPQLDSVFVTATDSLATMVIDEKHTQSDSAEKASSLPLSPIRLGISSNKAKGQEITYGPFFEYFIGKRVSIEAGIHFSPSYKERYHTISDFNEKTGLSFGDEYPGSISKHDVLVINKYNTFTVTRRDSLDQNGNAQVRYDTVTTVRYDSTYNSRLDSVQSINRFTRTVRLPLRINYYRPITPNLSILVVTGSSLELSVSQRVRFKSVSTNHEKNVQFDKKVSPVTFNNLFFGAGIEYHYKKLAFQLVPYYHHQLKSSNYRKTKSTVGANVSLRFNLQ
ncbi:hypothetical protein EFA69_08800 [Rufibacter immobilis]|uniref:Outer membrane protein beta-barrel domain-containing protein n=1 Tax=Rufibacter immobilis TaxID=1348778 RepID=A0A3M9MX12_9BACT|nr:LapA family protein [Rufibacter immobilis]RNI29647.1 hypothetical protein EFA69_08800 [Rufibacter immobilis]